MAEAHVLRQCRKGDEWRNPFNRYLSWHEPPAPAPARLSIVRPAHSRGHPMVPTQFMADRAGDLCYCTHLFGKWWSRAAYRLKDGRWLLCRSHVSATARAAPKFAIVDELGDEAYYFSYDDMDWDRVRTAK